MVNDKHYQPLSLAANLDCEYFEQRPSIRAFLALLEEKEVRDYLQSYIDCAITMSEYNMLKRITVLEKALGLDAFADMDEEHEQTIPEQLSLLAERIDDIAEPIQGTRIDLDLTPRTLTEARAHLLVDHLRDTAPDPLSGEVFLQSNEVVFFLVHEIKEEYRTGKTKNIRQVKKEVLEKAVELYSTQVFLSKKKGGRREVRLILKPSEDRQSLQTFGINSTK